MGSLTTGFKKFLQNKNTVTIVGVVLAIFVLYIAYTMRVKSAINPVTVPYAAEQINAATQIKESMVSTMQVPPSMLTGDVILNKGEIVDKYASVDTVIPKGSLFYKRAVVEKEQLPTNIILEYPKGYVLYNLPVNINSTYGNSIYPGNYVDIWLKATYKYSLEEGGDRSKMDQINYGKLFSNVQVLAVKDASGQPVFQNLDEKRAPAMVVFALPQEYYTLLKKASYMRTFDTEIELVPTSESLKEEPGELELSSEQLKDWINQHTVYDPTAG